MGETKWIPCSRKIKQGCPLSPLLFSLLTADLPERLGRISKGVRVGGKRIQALLKMTY